MTAAKHRAIDFLRHNKRIERKHEEIGYAAERSNVAKESRRRAR